MLSVFSDKVARVPTIIIFEEGGKPLIAGSPSISLSLIVRRSKCDMEASVTQKQV